MRTIARSRWPWLAGILTLVALAATACGGSIVRLGRKRQVRSRPIERGQAALGRVQAGGGDAVRRQGRRHRRVHRRRRQPRGAVTAYVCNGSYDISAWLTGKLAAKAFDLSSDGGIAVSGSIAGTVASGTVTLADGSKHAFRAERSSAPAGLYELVNVEQGKVVRAATIVLPDGTSRGGTGRGNPP